MTITISAYGWITEPHTQQTSTGAPMTTCRLACEIPIAQTREVVTRWYYVLAFGSHAKTLARVPKGQSVCLYGPLSINRHTNEQGQQVDQPQITVEGLLCCATIHPDRSKAIANAGAGAGAGAEASTDHQQSINRPSTERQQSVNRPPTDHQQTRSKP